MSAIDEPITEIRTAHAAVEARAATAEAEKATLLQTVAQKDAEIARLTALLEAQPVPPPPEPEPPPVTPPGTAKPKILDENFTAPINWDVYYADKTPQDSVIVKDGRCLFRWKATSDLSHMRSQIVMKHEVGGGGTPRRDPIGSTRWYAFDLFLPPAYSMSDNFANQKCVTAQAHQGNRGNITNPPFSFEQIKTSADGEVMRGVLSLVDKERKTWNIGKPPRTPSKILMHVKWSSSLDGFLKVWRDGTLVINYNGPTCNPRQLNGETTDDLNFSIGCYNPGRKSGEFTVGYVREVSYGYWKIGTEVNTLEDFA